MAALLNFAPAHGVRLAADTVARLSRIVHATLRRQAFERPVLVQHWIADASGRLCCHWEVELPRDIPVPPD